MLEVDAPPSPAKSLATNQGPSFPPPLPLQVPSLFQVQSATQTNQWGLPRAYSFSISYTTSQLLPGEAGGVGRPWLGCLGAPGGRVWLHPSYRGLPHAPLVPLLLLQPPTRW